MILPFLSGLAQGASEAYNNVAEEKRKQKTAQQKLVSDAILKKLETDDTLTPDEHVQLQQHFYKLNGIDDKTAQGLIQASSQFRQAHDEDQRKQVMQSAQDTMSQPAAPLQDAQAPVNGLGDLPTMGQSGGGSAMKGTAMAPPIPQFKQQTIGDLNLPQQARKAGQIAATQAQAQREAQLAMMDAEDEYKFNKIDEIDKRTDLTPDQKYQRKLIIDPKLATAQGRAGAATFVPAVMSGKDLKARLISEGKTPEEQASVDDKGYYRVALDPTKTKTVSWFATQPNTYQGKTSLGSMWKSQFATDLGGNPVDDNQLYVPVLSRAGGTPVGVVPETLVNTYTVKNNLKSVQQPDGSTTLVPVTETSQNIKTPQGASAGTATPATPLPQAPTGTSASSATPTPKTPLPKAGGARVLGPGVTVGGKAMTPKEKVTAEQQADLYNTSIGTIKSLQRDVPVLASLISSGKIGMQVNPDQGVWSAIINKNMPLTPAEARVAAHWQQLADQILELRIPLGAAAGRNAQMMNTIEANKGILTQKPEIIQRMLDNALGEFRNLRTPLATAGKKYGFDVQAEREHAIDEDNKKLSKEELDRILHGAK